MVAKPPFWNPVFHCGVKADRDADSPALTAAIVVSHAVLTAALVPAITLPESSYSDWGACAAIALKTLLAASNQWMFLSVVFAWNCLPTLTKSSQVLSRLETPAGSLGRPAALNSEGR